MRTMTIIYAAALVALGAVIGSGYAQAANFGDAPIRSAWPAPQMYQPAPPPGYTVSPYTPPAPPPMYCSRQPGGGMYCWSQ